MMFQRSDALLISHRFIGAIYKKFFDKNQFICMVKIVKISQRMHATVKFFVNLIEIQLIILIIFVDLLNLYFGKIGDKDRIS